MFKTIKLTATTENYPVLSKWLNETIGLWNLSNNLLNKIDVCAEEVFVNISSYAYGNNTGIAQISANKNDNEIILVFEDEGAEYNPLQKEDPDITLTVEERPIGGLGIFMVKQMAKNVEYERKDNKNILKLTFDIE